MLARRLIVGTSVTIADYAEVLDFFDQAVAKRTPSYVCCTPVHSLIIARRDVELAAALAGASVVTPDGMGVVWGARLLGESIKGRVYGPDLMLYQCERAAAAGHRVWLYGGHDQDAVEQLRQVLESRFPGLNIVGAFAPPYRPLDASETTAIADQINAARADVVWVGLGSPKQEKWMAQMRDQLEAPVLCGVGAAFDFHIGRVKQAPRWVQRRGLEWAFRIAQEPARLGPRYLSSNPAFVALVARQWWNERSA